MIDLPEQRHGKQSHDQKYGRLDTVEKNCKYCSHKKMWKKKGKLECRKCKKVQDGNSKR